MAARTEPEVTIAAERGVIAIDNVLIDHYGKMIEVVGDFWDHVEERNKIAHDCLFANCQLRDGQGQTRHMYLVMMAYSLLTSQRKQARARDWALCKLMTIGEASRAMLRETLRQTLAWAVDQIVNKSRQHKEVLMQLGLA